MRVYYISNLDVIDPYELLKNIVLDGYCRLLIVWLQLTSNRKSHMLC